MAEAKAGILAVEVGKTLLLDKPALVAEADRRAIAIVGITRDGEGA
jgi:DUF1009 family protein